MCAANCIVYPSVIVATVSSLAKLAMQLAKLA